MGNKISRLAGVAILGCIICSLLILPACSEENKASTASGPIRFLDDPDFMNSLQDYYHSLQHETTFRLAGANWVNAGDTIDEIPAFFHPLPQDCVIQLQPADGSDRTKILYGDEEISHVESHFGRADGKDEYWKYTRPIEWTGTRIVPPGTAANFRINAEYSQTRLIVNLTNIRPEASIRLSLDGVELATLKGNADLTAVFDGRISVSPGVHVLNVEHKSNSEDAGPVTISGNSTIGLGDGILFFSKRDPRTMSMEMKYSATPRGATAFIARVRREKHHYFYQPGFPGSGWMFSAMLSNGVDNDATYRCVPLFSPFTRSWRGRLPENDPELQFVYAYVSGKHGKGDGLLVTVQPISAPDEAVSIAIDPQNIGRTIWYEQRIDLSHFTGRTVDIIFRYNCSPIEGLDERHLLIGEPIITSRGKTTDSHKPNVVLISLDTCRGDRRAGAGWERDTMPFLDELAADAIDFTNARSQTSWTLPSHKSILTGLYPHTLNYLSGRFNSDTPIPTNVPTLASMLKDNGYLTQAFTESGLMSSIYGFSRGFDGYEEFKKSWGWDVQIDGSHRIAKDINWQKAQHWIEQFDSDSPFFLFLHTYGPHVPYSSLGYDDLFDGDDPETALPPDIRSQVEGKPGEKAVQHIGVAYDRNLRRTDDALRSIVMTLKRKGLYENTLLIVTSDHGEMISEHDTYGGHGTAWDAVLHIPMVIRLPGGEWGGKRITEEVQLVDLTPTILDLLHLSVPYYSQGASITSLITGESSSTSPFRFANFHYDWITHRNGGFRLHLNNGEVAIYDMVNDPGELDNLLQDGRFPAEDLDRMVRSLILYYSEMAPGWNILVTPPPGTRLLVTVEGYQWPFESKTGKTRRFDFGAFVAHFNTDRVEVTGKPALIQLEPPRGEAFNLSIRKFDESGKKWVPIELPVGIHFGSMERKTPTPVSLAIVKKRAPSCRERGASDWLQDYPVCVWFSRTSVEFSGNEKSVVFDEKQQEALRNLGYLQ